MCSLPFSVSGLKVSAIEFTNVGTTSLSVRWTAPLVNSELLIDHYRIEWYLLNTVLSSGNGSVQYTTNSYEIKTGITPGKAYNVKITSVNTRTESSKERTVSEQKEQSSSK